MTGDFIPRAPSDWPEHRRARFDKIAGALPRGWWTPGNEGLLHEYVTALEACDALQRLLDRLDAEGIDPAANVGELGPLLAMRDREAKRAIQLARAMRLTRLSLPMPREGSFTPADESAAPWSA
jgi:hypothetical protein